MATVPLNENSTLNMQENATDSILNTKANVEEANATGKETGAPPQKAATTRVLTSCDSERLSDLARPRSKGLAPSLPELEKIYRERQQQRLADARKRNDRSMNRAIHHPDTKKTVEPRGLTVPREFNLSAPPTPSRSRSATPSCTPLRSRSRCTTPLRSRCNSQSNTPARSVCMSSDGGTPSRGRTPSNKALTVARGPDLMTSFRPRSVSRGRGSDRYKPMWSETLRGQCEARAESRSHSRRPSESPARSRSGWNYGTPLSQRGRDRSNDSISSDMALSMPGSVRSRMERSCDSRTSQMSQRSRSSSISRQKLSTEEIEQVRIAAKRGEMKELIKMNAKRGRQAILCPQPTVSRRSLSLTVPREFTLSVGTPNRSCNHSYMSDAGSDCEDQPKWSRSLRSVPASPSRTAWKPALTVPEAPRLRTEQRSRSSSQHRSVSGTPSKRSLSRHRLPREQAAIERHLERTDRIFEDHSSTQSKKPAWDDSTNNDAQEVSTGNNRSKHSEVNVGYENSSKEQEGETDNSVQAPQTAEERAKRAREEAERKYNEKAAAKANLKCFTGPKAQPRPAGRGRTGSASQTVPVHERLYREKDDRRRRKESADVQKIEQEEEEIRASAERARGASPGRAASPVRAASPGRAGSPSGHCSPKAKGPEEKEPQ